MVFKTDVNDSIVEITPYVNKEPLPTSYSLDLSNYSVNEFITVLINNDLYLGEEPIDFADYFIREHIGGVLKLAFPERFI